ncbi:Cysteine-rich venom protein DIS2 [Orchesella cincta]|uniref:Cysteine-rich venom protein DIS2 n=1 Tax=Orchesella cincta TaxID=48709 RepID=A0A1D2NG44_ORCCI|nr:Cysteine-rich venom protein DIS2 [Orchesella cincta]
MVMFLNRYVFVLITLLLLAQHTDAWRHDRRPRVFGNRMPKSMLVTTSKKVQEKIVAAHNLFRANVKPSASNMLEMSWHAGAAKKAQRWAEQCQMLTHDNATDRWTEFYGPCGQNIFIATHKVPWFFAIKMWYLEYKNFTYGSSRNDLGVVGHYTQMVWAATHKVGCGYAQCKTSRGKPYFNYICNYCPIGNYIEHLGRPYNKGPSCGECPDHCSAETNLCTNACPFADLWVNCHELNTEWHEWLCKDKSKEGLRRRKHCRATCHCKNKILPRYS